MKQLKQKVALALGLLAMSAAPTLAQGVPCEAFRRNPNGSWSVLRPIQLQGPNGVIGIGPGMTFSPGVQFMGIDLGALLYAQCSHIQ